jgi:2-oxoglutarate dehydrogenase E2 component (dihydrolipoamide succinyltransferase)
MTFEVRLPRLAESISEAVLVEWLRPDGARVAIDEPIATLETDKAAVEIAAEQAGVLRHARQLRDRLQVGDVLARIEDGDGAAAAVAPATPAAKPSPPAGSAAAATPAAAPSPPAGSVAAATPPASAASPAPPPAPAPLSAPGPAASAPAPAPLSPAVRRLVEENAVDLTSVEPTGRGGRILKEDVLRQIERARAAAGTPPVAPPSPPAVAALPSPPAVAAPPPAAAAESPRVVPMSAIRQRIAERLVRAQHTAAILTTFNEIDMSAVLELRARHREEFERRHGVRLGLMSFFARASILALADVPELNAEIRGSDIVYHPRVHLGVAVQTPRGLVVPVARAADALDFAGIEREIARLAERARVGALTLDELSGGTFTVSNGGVFGSLLSTPILNPPQSGILGMHKIEKRPVALDDQVVVRPMMYVALSYDHRLVDGEQAVTFLVRVKERLESPGRMLLGV